jgi:hypothetical protein
MDTRELVKYLWVNRSDVSKLAEVGVGIEDAKTYFKLYPSFVPSN